MESASGGSEEVGFGTRLDDCLRALAALVGEVEPERFSGESARVLTELFAWGERLCATGKTLVAQRVVNTGAWERSGERTAADWLGRVSGQTAGQAAATIVSARRMRDQPDVERAARAGRLSEAQSAAVTAAADKAPAKAAELVSKAGSDSLLALRERSRQIVLAADERAEKERHRAIHAGRYLRWWADDDGAGRISGRFTPDRLALIVSALQPFQDDVFRHARSAGTRERRECHAADALVNLAVAATSTPPDLAGAGPDSGGRTGSGPTGSGPTGSGQTGDGQTGAGETGDGQTGGGQTGAGETGAGETGAGETGAGPTGAGETGGGETGGGETGGGPTGAGETGGGETGGGETGAGQASGGETGGWTGLGGTGLGGTPGGGPGGDESAAGHAGRAETANVATGSESGPAGDCRHAGREISGTTTAAGAAPSGRSGRRSGAGAGPPEGVAGPTPGGEGHRRAMIIVRVDHAALIRGYRSADECCDIDGIGPVPVATVRAMTADAYLAAVVTDGTDIRSVVHLGRSVTALQRTALIARDRECVVPGCHTRHDLEIDHVEAWAATKITRLDSLARLCHHHHHQKTYEGWQLEGPPGRWKWRPPAGDNPDRSPSQQRTDRGMGVPDPRPPNPRPPNPRPSPTGGPSRRVSSGSPPTREVPTLAVGSLFDPSEDPFPP